MDRLSRSTASTRFVPPLGDGSNLMSDIVVVEDESAIAELIAINLRHAGHDVTVAQIGRAHV